jgi:hypothetical protein
MSGMTVALIIIGLVVVAGAYMFRDKLIAAVKGMGGGSSGNGSAGRPTDTQR